MTSRRDLPFLLLLAFITLTPNLLSFYLFESPLKSLFAISTVAVGLLLHIKGFRVNIPRWVALLIGALLALYIFYNFSIEELPERLFLVADVLIFLQLISGNGFRTYLYAVLLSFLNIAIVGIAFPGIIFGVIVFIYLLLLIYFLLLLAVKSSGRQPDEKVYRHLLTYSVIAYLFTILVGSVLFFILPRPSKPIFSLISKKQTQTVISFTNDVRLGEFSNASLGNEPVFRAKIFGKVNFSELYWRGNALEIFRKGAWLPLREPYARTSPAGLLFREKIILLPYGDKNVFTYGYPVRVVKGPPHFLDNTKGVIFLKKVFAQAVGVELLATEKVRVKLRDPRVLLQVPNEVIPTMRRFVEEFNIKRGQNLGETLRALNAAFSHFEYSIDNPAKDLEEFLFKYRRGNCEYFASAAALILRFLGYPTRLVVGFYGGEYNPITGFFVVRQKDAHAWVEIYHHGTWVRYDATAVARKTPDTSPGVENLKKNKLALFLDTVSTLWLEYVIDLNSKKQRKIFRKTTEFIKQTLKHPPKIILVPLAIGALVYLLWRFRRKIILKLYGFYLRKKYRVRVGATSFADLYNKLWKRFPDVLQKERKRLLKLIELLG